MIEDCSNTYMYCATHDEIERICRGESRLEPKVFKNLSDFEILLILHFLSLQKICLPDFYSTLHECQIRANFLFLLF